MGIDACIYAMTSDGEPPAVSLCLEPNTDTKIVRCRHPPNDDPGQWFEVKNPWRYYGDGYPRGPWPCLAAILLSLFEAPNVVRVIYTGDTFDGPEVDFTPDDLDAMNRLWIQNGHDGYASKGARHTKDERWRR